jgi:hypothetical protein
VRRPVRLTRTRKGAPGGADLVSTIFMVDTIFGASYELLKKVLTGRLLSNDVHGLSRTACHTVNYACYIR